MRLDRQTISWFSESGCNTLRNIMIAGLEGQLKHNWDGEDLEFEECCNVWLRTLRKNTVTSLVMVCEDMNNQADDIFGTEGWEKGLGIPTF